MNTKRLYAAIEKTEELDDGTIKVWGYASAPSVDSDGETITADAMKAALPDYLKFGAVREMHNGSKAAGTAIEANVEDDGRTYFGAHVVDSEAVKKVRAKVYKGFSIGGRVTSRHDVEKSTITGLKLIEVSLVDRPANPDALFTMWKAEAELSAVDTLAKMVNDGEVTPEQLVELAKASLAAAVVAQPAPAEAIAAEPAVVTEKAEAPLEAVAPVVATVTAPEVIAPAAVPAEVAKAGARNSKSDATMIQAMHDSCCTLGADCATDKAASGGDIAKAAGLVIERDEALAKAATLTARVAELEAAPLNGKAILKALGKAEDIAASETAPVAEVKVIGFDGKHDPIASMIKSIHAAPIGGSL